MSLKTLPTADLLAFTVTLSTRDWRKLTKYDIAKISLFVASDGCSGVPDFYLDCCIIHDWFYRTHRDLDGTPITRAEADRRLKKCIQSESMFGAFSPMAWWRYHAVKRFGKKAWG